MLGWSSFMNHPQHHVSQAMWLLPGTWWAESPWCPAFWMVTQLQQSLTSTARTRIHVSRLDVQMQLRRMAGVAAMSNSIVYEVNTWLWMFGRGKPRLGGLTIEETSDRQDSARKASDKRRKETRDGRKDVA